MKKYGYWLICSAILFGFLILCYFKTDNYAVKKYPLEFSVEHDSRDQKITICESDNGVYYVFLPSYAELAALKIVAPMDFEVSLGGIPVIDGMSCENYKLETAYSLDVNGQYVAELYFFQSENIAAMYVDTLSGNMDRIHKDKNQSEQAEVVLYTADGILNVSDSTAYIKGRGNFTWYYSKRPYILTLSSDADVLGMGAAAKWILLANATDPTNLKNKLVLDLARQTGQGWSPESRFVDVYLNGKYAGLYLLTEKVEAGTSRLPIDSKSGDFLCRVDWERRWSSLKNPIKTQLGRTVEISSPDPLDQHSRAKVIDAINQMEQIIISGSDLSLVENFDLNSWVQRYLLDEISGNIDADMLSSYFYHRDGIFYAGPAWDYDMTFGNAPRNVNAVAYVAKNKYKIDSSVSYYHDALYNNESFYNKMVEYYRLEFLPHLNYLTERGIYDMAAQIQSAAIMDQLRWHGKIPIPKDAVVHTVDDLVSFLENRVLFLNSVWLEGTEYCALQFKLPGQEEYWNVAVKKGDLLETDYLDLENTTWIDKDTGSQVDFSQPVVCDMVLVQQHEVNAPDRVIDRNSLDIFVSVFSVTVLVVFFFCMVYTDVLHRRKEGGATDERKQAHVSP